MWTIISNKFISLVATILVTTSCSNNSNLYIGDITTNIKFTNKTEVTGEEIKLSEEHKAGLYKINIVDNYIIGSYYEKPYFYYCFDKTTFTPIKEFIYNGRGDNEMLLPSILNKQSYDSLGNITLNIEDVNMQGIFKANVTSYINGELLKIEKLTSMTPGQFFPELLNEDQIISKNYDVAESSVYIEIFDIENPTKKERIKLSQHPVTEIFMNDTFIMTVKPDGSKTAMATCLMNQIMILDIGNKVNHIFTTDKEAPKWKVIKDAEIMEDVYTHIASNNDFIFAIKQDITRGSLIEIWDWKGNPVKEILITKPHSSATIDIKDKKLYTITSEEELWVYNLEGVI